jgi:hypothetical protein
MIVLSNRAGETVTINPLRVIEGKPPQRPNSQTSLSTLPGVSKALWRFCARALHKGQSGDRIDTTASGHRLSPHRTRGLATAASTQRGRSETVAGWTNGEAWGSTQVDIAIRASGLILSVPVWVGEDFG